jgi:hypothetical protein
LEPGPEVFMMRLCTQTRDSFSIGTMFSYEGRGETNLEHIHGEDCGCDRTLYTMQHKSAFNIQYFNLMEKI